VRGRESGLTSITIRTYGLACDADHERACGLSLRARLK